MKVHRQVGQFKGKMLKGKVGNKHTSALALAIKECLRCWTKPPRPRQESQSLCQLPATLQGHKHITWKTTRRTNQTHTQKILQTMNVLLWQLRKRKYQYEKKMLCFWFASREIILGCCWRLLIIIWEMTSCFLQNGVPFPLSLLAKICTQDTKNI